MTAVQRVVAVTPNPAVDVTYRVAEQRLGETVRVQEVIRRPGGKGVNVARVLAALGVPVVALQPVGGPTGDLVSAGLAQLGVEAVLVPSPVETRTTVAVVDDLSHPTLLSEPGGHQPPAVWDRLVAAVARLAVPRGWVVVSGSLPPGTPDGRMHDLVAAARDAGSRVLVDSSGPALLAAASAGVDVLGPNAAEALEATGTTGLDAAAEALLDAGAGTVVVSRGGDGLTAWTADRSRLDQPAVPGVTGNPTGAGDAATAGLVAALGRGATPADALREAAVTGAAAVLAPVAGEVDPDVLAGLADRLPTSGAPPLPTTPRTR
ncbi:hexose kinase [Phycicoccus sp. CSK15P-2]|uniref:1-phosphofructokinase family hexose kinase n=1 Tax=Phycicoccus sp. CSK15P-2 TaxID=2807627 RepID=UPI001951DBCE|nr:hexose kinase [Phycicoccus sp. CSK15P-2]MBM6405864.1 hexose kinase [Phycicoccus sp. CSK15P-2]